MSSFLDDDAPDVKQDHIKGSLAVLVPRSLSQAGQERTNSVDRKGNQLRRRQRLDTNGAEQANDEEAGDHCLIAVFSREDSLHFGVAYRNKMENDELARLTKSSKTEDETTTTMRAFVGRQPAIAVGTDFQDQMSALLRDKSIPHVVAVVEGAKPQDDFKIKHEVDGNPFDIPYVRKHFLQGQRSLQGQQSLASENKDPRQNFTIYVRKDMERAYHFTNEEVKVGSEPETIKCVGVNYKTKDGTSYRSLVVHIPNKLAKDTAFQSTHKAFQQYAENEANKSSPVVVTGYLGDTNYRMPFRPGSAASVGGITLGGKTFHPQASSAVGETNFMQSVAMSRGANAPYRVLQPSTLNYVFINQTETDKTATDHPSIMHYTWHSDMIVGRDPQAIPKYYPGPVTPPKL